MRAWVSIVGAGIALALAGCTSLLGDDFEISETGGTTTGTGGGTTASGGGGTGGSGGGATGGGGTGGGAPAPGTVLWEAAFGDSSADTAAGLAYLSDRSLVVAGSFADSLDFGGGALVSAHGVDVFVVRLAPNGQQVWATQYGTTDHQRASSVDADGADNLLLYGTFENSIQIGSLQLNAVDEEDLFGAKLSAEGQAVWVRAMSSNYIDTAYEVRSDPANNPVFTGTFQDGIDIGVLSLTGPSQTASTFVTKLSGSNGQGTWAEAATPAGYPDVVRPMALGVDDAGNLSLLLSAGTQGNASVSITYGGTTQSAPNQSLLALLRTDGSGNRLWATEFSTARGSDVSTFSNGDVLVCGTYSGAGTFAPGFTMPPSEGGRDVWVAKYSDGGALLWARRYGGTGAEGGGTFPPQVRCKALPSLDYLVAAHSDGPFDAGGTVVPGNADSVVVAQLDSAGVHRWSARTSGPATLVDLDTTEGEAALLLNFADATGLSGSFTSAGALDIYVARIAL